MFFANFVFWLFVIAAKVAFDWFAVFSVLDSAIVALWNRGWLNYGQNAAADGDFVLVIARAVPVSVAGPACAHRSSYDAERQHAQHLCPRRCAANC